MSEGMSSSSDPSAVSSGSDDTSSLPTTPDLPPSEDDSQPEDGMPPESPTPYPWTWTCHRCGQEYRLGVTRRCLRDGHYYCTARVGDRPKRICFAEFDYSGWREFNDWHHEVRKLKEEEEQASKKRKRSSSSSSSSFWAMCPKPQQQQQPRKRNCWENCDYPSECHHSCGAADDELLFSSDEDEEWQPARKIRRIG
ncbi:hypothetical protein VTN96DRAFT_566 [Rasamsonia emersonii]|uniref:Uncharacterized protein n=1 Tax=Rasamsonia emersonii (strain ATCC 16479 / CBS 393.64 / IMI 116815) TaxID=1408163 RepID=A0A0F4YZM7_RASE3|nr:hypothetical protein T310_2824 [Rasamsonia emersonii CBS 393.64]KKA23098.1 hypothetical protein T310_2824 [Rasamsonia emersonii CBS 393.64]